MQVAGTNFHVTAIPAPNPGMKAYIDGAETTVSVLSETLALVVSLPVTDLVGEIVERDATLRLVNIDENGAPITGEEATKGFKYSKEVMLAPAEMPFICELYLSLLQHLVGNYKITVAQSTDADYTIEGELLRVIGQPPAIILSDFALEETRITHADPVVDGKRYRYTLYFILSGTFVVVARNFEDALRYIVSLYQFQRRVPYLEVQGVRVKLKLDKRSSSALNIGEGIKAWTVGWTLEPVVVECPEELDVMFEAAEVLLETYKLPLPEEEE
jgi:hypothetical protein